MLQLFKGNTLESDKTPTVCIMDITPIQAENWLQYNVENNRHLDNKLVDRYKNIMLAGDWHLSNDAISFNINNMLVNGQHRLWAIVESGVTIRCIVQKNLPLESMDCMDVGKHRTNDDNFKIAGKNYPKDCSATVRCIFNSLDATRCKVYNHNEIAKFMDKYHESIIWAHQALPTRGKFGCSAFRAVVARAHILGKPLEKLNRFCTVLTTGLNTPEDGAALLLRNRILEPSVKDKGKNNRRNQKEFYSLAETALANFLNNKTPARLLPIKNEAFPIDGVDSFSETKE